MTMKTCNEKSKLATARHTKNQKQRKLTIIYHDKLYLLT